MRVLLIDVNCKDSSTGRIVYDIYASLNAQGDMAAVCYGRGKQIYEQNIYKFGLDWETKLHALLTRLTGFTGCFSFFSTKRLIQYIEDFRPDVVHIHELHAYFVNIATLLNYLADRRIKVVHTLHCEFSYTGKCGHSIDCEKWMKECGNCPRVKAYPKSLFFDQTRAMFRKKKEAFARIQNLTIVAPSEWLSERARNSFFSNRPIYTVHNGVDTAVFYPRDTKAIRKELGIDEKEKVVLSVAPHLMSESKGGRFILRLAKRMKEKARFVLVGVDGESLRKDENIILMGPVYDKNRLAELYSLADTFCICSIRENFPTTCLEAQSCGTPICGFDTGGTKETCITPIHGQFVVFGDLEALERCVMNVPQKPNEIASWLSENAGTILGYAEMEKRYREIYCS